MPVVHCPKTVSAESNHAALLNNIYRRQRHIYDFTRKYYLFGRDRLIGLMRPTADACILEIGCGTARNLIRLAKCYPGRRLFGLDASEAMLETAQRAIDQAGLSGQISLARAYAEDLDRYTFGLDTVFDDIVFSYSLSHDSRLEAGTSGCVGGSFPARSYPYRGFRRSRGHPAACAVGTLRLAQAISRGAPRRIDARAGGKCNKVR